MKEKLIISGFGGQGSLLVGKLLTYAAMLDGRHVTFLPSYGAEVRGGTAYCNVIISDEEIASPTISIADTLIAMNLPSVVRFEPAVVQEGLIFINSSLIEYEPDRKDVRTVRIPATEIADGLGNIKVANMVMVGAYLAKKEILSRERVHEALGHLLPEHRRSLYEINCRAIEEGYKLTNNQTPRNKMQDARNKIQDTRNKKQDMNKRQ